MEPETDNTPFEEGVIKVYYRLKGFGFITRPHGREILFHYTDLGDPEIPEGCAVKYKVILRNGKRKAATVMRSE